MKWEFDDTGDRTRVPLESWLEALINDPAWNASGMGWSPDPWTTSLVNPWSSRGVYSSIYPEAAAAKMSGAGASPGSAGPGAGKPVGPGGVPLTGPEAVAAGRGVPAAVATGAGAGGASTLAKVLQTAVPFIGMGAGAALAPGRGSSGLNDLEEQIRRLLALQEGRIRQAQPTYEAMLALANAMAPNTANWQRG